MDNRGYKFKVRGQYFHVATPNEFRENRKDKEAGEFKCFNTENDEFQKFEQVPSSEKILLLKSGKSPLQVAHGTVHVINNKKLKMEITLLPS